MSEHLTAPSFALLALHRDSGEPITAINARELHASLGVKKDFTDWIKAQVDRALLAEGRDYLTDVYPQKGENPNGGRPRSEYYLTIEAAKHVAMMSGTEKGRAVRDYFIEIERRAQMAADPSRVTRADLARMILDAEAEIAQLQHQVQEAAPKVAALERIAEASTGSTCITTAAKALAQPPRALFGWLQQQVWIYRRSGSASWCAYQHRLAAGLLEHKVTTVTRPDGTEKVVHQVLVTPKGLAKLGEAFGRKAVAA